MEALQSMPQVKWELERVSQGSTVKSHEPMHVEFMMEDAFSANFTCQKIAHQDPYIHEILIRAVIQYTWRWTQ